MRSRLLSQKRPFIRKLTPAFGIAALLEASRAILGIYPGATTSKRATTNLELPSCLIVGV
jgi:hypothetical protein